ncbi:MAG: hypothetical protein UX72_C0012G0022 [Parcubacteria group bacterium GW2011_GWA2_47_10]|nr:MAG: hypothetical protein UX72_C0012G0022 [Parcubacteria group bacterium GW2011_GWA2_47_10]
MDGASATFAEQVLAIRARKVRGGLQTAGGRGRPASRSRAIPLVRALSLTAARKAATKGSAMETWKRRITRAAEARRVVVVDAEGNVLLPAEVKERVEAPDSLRG